MLSCCCILLLALSPVSARPFFDLIRIYKSAKLSEARFKRRATAVPNSIDRIKFDLSTAVARLGFKRRATAVPNSIHKL